jgi:hypothetical protein
MFTHLLWQSLDRTGVMKMWRPEDGVCVDTHQAFREEVKVVAMVVVESAEGGVEGVTKFPHAVCIDPGGGRVRIAELF